MKPSLFPTVANRNAVFSVGTRHAVSLRQYAHRICRDFKDWFILQLLPRSLSLPRNNRSRSAITFAALLCISASARAQDGALDWGGTPRPLSGHSNLELRSETVKIDIGKELVRVDSQLVLINRGAACDVLIGFPDDSAERMGGGYETTLPPSAFESFQVFVDGKKVPSRTVRGPVASGIDTIWRVQTVRFAARGQRGSTRTLQAQFSAYIGGESTFKSELVDYTLRTGAHWRGPIERSEITATFERAPGRVIRAVALERLQKRSKVDVLSDYSGKSEMARRLKTPGNVVYSGPGRAQVRGNIVRWIRTKWRPTSKDDVSFWFKMPS